MSIKLKSLAEANKALERYYPQNLRRPAYSLDYINLLLTFLGDPQEKMKVLHVAGTSGKTSTCFYAASLLRAAGKRVGNTMSPHIDDINDRVQIGLVPMPEAEFCAELSEFLNLVEKSGVEATYFEIMTAFAFWTFWRHGVEYAVIEVGVGGLLDASNVVGRPDKIAVITDVGLDHQKRLGNTLSEIAGQKAGIIQLKNAVFCYRQADDIMEAITARASQKQADLHTFSGPDLPDEYTFLPEFQKRNFYLALQAVLYMAKRDGFKITASMRQTAAKVLVPGRMEEATYRGRTIVLDGAHNAQKLHALAVSLRAMYPGKDVAALVAFIDSDAQKLPSASAEFANLASHLIVTQLPLEGMVRGFEDPDLVVAHSKTHGLWSTETRPGLKPALDALAVRPEPVLVVTGSLSLVSAVRKLLRKTL